MLLLGRACRGHPQVAAAVAVEWEAGGRPQAALQKGALQLLPQREGAGIPGLAEIQV